MGDTSVRLAAYDPLWPMMFEAEAARIEEACAGLALRLEHIGSTAVPGMSAKPVIDILAGRPPRSQPAPYIAAIRQLGYEHKAPSAFRDASTSGGERRAHTTFTS